MLPKALWSTIFIETLIEPLVSLHCSLLSIRKTELTFVFFFPWCCAFKRPWHAKLYWIVSTNYRFKQFGVEFVVWLIGWVLYSPSSQLSGRIMRQLLTIAWNAFTELMRQPVFLLLMTSSSVFSIFLACTPYFGFGEDPKLVKDSVLATLLLVGLFCAVISASYSVAHEIMSGTALAVLSKPVGRMVFLLGKNVL